MVKPIRLGKIAPLLTAESVEPVSSGDDEDYDGGGYEGEASVNDQWKQPVRAATTASITIATALNAGDTLDGVALAAGDRVLVKDQGTGSQNGIYIVGATPERAPDFDDDGEVLGAIVYVIAGTANAATAWKVTNTSAVTVGTTAIVFAAFGSGGSTSFGTPAVTYGTPAAGVATTAIRTDAVLPPPDAADIPIVDTGGYFTGTDVEAALQELGAGGGGGALDDLSDVNAPSPSNGDVLTWDSTPGEWVAAAPSGVSGGATAEVNAAARVTAYNLFR